MEMAGFLCKWWRWTELNRRPEQIQL